MLDNYCKDANIVEYCLFRYSATKDVPPELRYVKFFT